MQYDSLRYVDQSLDPSFTIETQRLVAKVIDNTGLSVPANPERKSFFGSYGANGCMPITHHLGYHGIRTLYDKTEKRNVVIPFASWLNLQGVKLEGIENDPRDERSAYGVGRGWPIRMERSGAGVRLTIDPMPSTRFRYTLDLHPAEPDAIDFKIRFTFFRRPDAGKTRAYFSWPCYINGWDDAAFHYPKGESLERFAWASIGTTPEMVLGESVGYVHKQKAAYADQQAMPVGFGRIGKMMLAIMFSDPRVRFLVVNAGGHQSWQSIQNPAWDFDYAIDDYPLETEIGFDGRLVYAPFVSGYDVIERYLRWQRGREPQVAR